jgi:hypothetical protein
MERGKTREASDGNQNCKKFNFICEIWTLKNFQYLPYDWPQPNSLSMNIFHDAFCKILKIWLNISTWTKVMIKIQKFTLLKKFQIFFLAFKKQCHPNFLILCWVLMLVVTIKISKNSAHSWEISLWNLGKFRPHFHQIFNSVEFQIFNSAGWTLMLNTHYL